MKQTRSILTAMAFMVVALFTLSSTPAGAVEIADGHQLIGYYQIFALLNEDSTKVTAGGNTSGDTAFGFKEKRARLGVQGGFADGLLTYKVLTEWAGSGDNGLHSATLDYENSPHILDYWLSLNPMDGAVQVRVGRFKPFTTYEGMSSAAALPNLERSLAARTISGSYFAVNYAFRDLGALFTIKAGPADILISATNGVGGGADVGGNVTGGVVATNDFGNAMYSIGVIAKPVAGLRVNASYNNNNHKNVSVPALAAVGDVNRDGYSAGFEFKSGVGLWLDGEYMFFESDKKDVLIGETEQKGYFVRAGFWVIPSALNVSARYESFENGKSNSVTDKGTSVAATYTLAGFSTTLEYVAWDGEAGSMYGTSDPSALRLRLQVKL